MSLRTRAGARSFRLHAVTPSSFKVSCGSSEPDAECRLIFPEAQAPQPNQMSMMRPRLLLAPYHPASGTERAFSGVGIRKSSEAAGAGARKAVVGAKLAMKPSELLVNAAVDAGITSIATVHDSFGCLPSRAERFRMIIREQFVARGA